MTASRHATWETGTRLIPGPTFVAAAALALTLTAAPVGAQFQQAGPEHVEIETGRAWGYESLAAQHQRASPVTWKWLRDCNGCPKLRVVPAGEYWMGSPEGEGSDYERPRHRVTIDRAFAVGVYEVTFGEWDACRAAGGCAHNPDDEGWGRGSRPVINVRWWDARKYVRWLTKKTGKRYRLPSEAEWEYVARAGTTTAYHFGGGISPSQANYDESGHGKTVPVGSYPANRFGLHDVHGNVWEWVEDCWFDSYWGGPSDGSAWRLYTGGLFDATCVARVRRGGSWGSGPGVLRSANRGRDASGYRHNYNGFHVARTLD